MYYNCDKVFFQNLFIYYTVKSVESHWSGLTKGESKLEELELNNNDEKWRKLQTHINIIYNL